MKIIGLTGGSGTGKGTVAARMRALGAGWVDADAVVISDFIALRMPSPARSARRTAKCWPHSTPPLAS